MYQQHIALLAPAVNALLRCWSAGHMIPIDQPKAARRMVDMIMGRHAKLSRGTVGGRGPVVTAARGLVISDVLHRVSSET